MAPISPHGGAKELALLAYLAVEAAQPHSRERVAALLWPETSDTAARNSLRVALTVLRNLLGESAASALVANRSTLQFVPDNLHQLDVAVFTQHLATARRHQHPPGDLCAACLTALMDATALYRGDFPGGCRPARQHRI